MSLTSFLNVADVRANLKPLRPNLPRKIAAPLKVEPTSNRFWVIGTAFDYLLRFEIQRRAPHAVARAWVAEQAPDLIWKETRSGCGSGVDVLAHAFPNLDQLFQEGEKRIQKLRKDERAWVDAYLAPSLPCEKVEKRARKIETDAAAAVDAFVKLSSPSRAQRIVFATHIIRMARLYQLAKLSPQDKELKAYEKEAMLRIDTYADLCPKGYLRPKEVEVRARKILQEAKSAVAEYLNLRKPNRATLENLAAHAIRLAHLDAVVRALKLDPTFEAANPEDVEDLLALLAVVPFDALLHDRILLLNPTFGEASKLVGGADADLITGDMLVDFKATKRDSMQPEDLDSLLGYYLLARHQRQIDSKFPEIKRLSFYFCRHGYLWMEDVTTWTDHPQFAEVEKWFFKRAEGFHGQAQKVGRS